MTDEQNQPKDPIPSELVREDASLADLVEEFLGTIPERLREMETAINSSDFDILRRRAHQLKGSGGGYGYPAVTELAARLEQQAVGGQLTSCQQALEELHELVGRLVVSTD